MVYKFLPLCTIVYGGVNITHLSHTYAHTYAPITHLRTFSDNGVYVALQLFLVILVSDQ